MEKLTFLTENLSDQGKESWQNINEEYLTQLNLIGSEEFGLPVDIEL